MKDAEKEYLAQKYRNNSLNGKIRYVCIDMSQAYSKRVEDTLPEAKVVFDHFHLIKAMIEYTR